MSISSDFAKAKTTNPSLQFADYKKTWTDPSAAAKTQTIVSEKDYNTAVQKEAVKAQTDVLTKSKNSGTATTATAGGWVDGRWVTGAAVAANETSKAAESTKTDYQKYKAGEMTIEEYRSSQKATSAANAESEANKVELAKKAADSAIKSDAVGKELSGKVGDLPTPPVAPEGGWTAEEEQAAQLNYQKQLVDYYKNYGEEAQKQLGDVSGQVATFSDQLKQYQGALDAITSQINAAQPGLGSELSAVISEISETGNGNITPESLAKIQQLADEGLTAEEFKSQAKAILTSTTNAERMQASGVTDSGDSYTLPNQLTFKKGANGLPDLSIEAIPAGANSYDIALMEAATNNAIIIQGGQSELTELQNLSKSVKRATETARADVENTFDTSQAKVDEEKLSAMNAAAYQKAKLELEKDNSLSNILEQEAQMEGYMRGQLEAWGADQSTAALSVMGNVKTKFLKQYTDTEKGYNIELSNVSNLMTEASLAYTNRSIEIANAKALGLQKINDGLLDSIDNIFSKTSDVYKNTDLKLLQNNTNYYKDILSLKQAEAEAQQETLESTRDFNLKLMKEYADQTGYQYKMNDDGSIELVTDANGTPVMQYKKGKSDTNNNSYSSSGEHDSSGGMGWANFGDSLLGLGTSALIGTRGKPIDTTIQPVGTGLKGKVGATDRNKAEIASVILQGLVDGKSYEDLVAEKRIGNTQTSQSAYQIAQEEYNKRSLWTSPVKAINNVSVKQGSESYTAAEIYADAEDDAGKEAARKVIIDELVKRGTSQADAKAYVNRTFNQ